MSGAAELETENEAAFDPPAPEQDPPLHAPPSEQRPLSSENAAPQHHQGVDEVFDEEETEESTEEAQQSAAAEEEDRREWEARDKAWADDVDAFFWQELEAEILAQRGSSGASSSMLFTRLID
jgi:hypothetical protein